MAKQGYNEMLEEMLDLAGVPLDEQDEDEEDVEAEAEPQEDEAGEAEAEDDEGRDEELQDRWEAQISSGGKFKIEWTDSYIWVWYKNKRSDRIAIPARLKPYRSAVSSLFQKIINHIEEKS